MTRVTVSKVAQKQLRAVPRHVANKPRVWVRFVGERRGQRSIRLSRAYRAIYEIRHDGGAWFVSIEEVTKHGY